MLVKLEKKTSHHVLFFVICVLWWKSVITQVMIFSKINITSHPFINKCVCCEFIRRALKLTYLSQFIWQLDSREVSVDGCSPGSGHLLMLLSGSLRLSAWSVFLGNGGPPLSHCLSVFHHHDPPWLCRHALHGTYQKYSVNIPIDFHVLS